MGLDRLENHLKKIKICKFMENCLKKLVGIMVAMVAILFAGCNDDENAQNNNGNYPPTANVIPNAVTDIDGNSYDAVRIGDQIWMASNLRTTHYADGEEIEQNGMSFEQLNDLYEIVPEAGNFDPDFLYPDAYVRSFCNRSLGASSTDVVSYGYLYNYYAALYPGSEESDRMVYNYFGNEPLILLSRVRQGVCPNGWHLPSDAEWHKLFNYCRSHGECTCSGSVNNIAKSLAANRAWKSSTRDCAVGNDLSANNSTGFSALPAGEFFYSYGYVNYGVLTFFWSTTTDSEDIDGYGNDISVIEIFDNTSVKENVVGLAKGKLDVIGIEDAYDYHNGFSDYSYIEESGENSSYFSVRCIKD